MRTRNLAIVFADLHELESRGDQRTLAGNRQRWDSYQRLATPIFTAFEGNIVKAVGDAFLVTFASPTQAVLCAMALQDRLWLHNRQAAVEDRLVVRIGASVGEVRLESGDIFGEPVNIAARVEGMTPPGEIYFSEAVYLAMNKAEVPAEELGPFELKGIPGTVKVFKVPAAPFRVQTVGPPEANEPPFGGHALARAEATERSAPIAAPVLAATKQAIHRGRWFWEATSPKARRNALISAGAVLFVVLLFLLFGRSRLNVALDSVVTASPAERDARAQEARTLIAAISDKGDREDAEGRLEEALGNPWRALRHFETAVTSGSSAAEKHLVKLLESPDCRVRSSAASALGELRLSSARSALERMKEEGGPNEGLDIPLIGCNSKTAAAQALSKLP